jgi:hypothetical protein
MEKPILKKPTKMGKAVEKEFTKQLATRDLSMVDMKEDISKPRDKALEQKRKIFDLQKMQGLVFSDPKLSAVYNEMSEDGQAKYGYHYNETIMNLIFNEYVINDVTYLQKYKSAIPVEKERRDATGIRAAKKQAREKNPQLSKGADFKDEGYDHNNSLPGVMEDSDETHGNFNVVSGYGYDQERDGTTRINRFNDTLDEEDVDETTGSASSGAFAPALGYKKKKFVDMKNEEKLKENDDPCWDGYKQVGTKDKDGKEVPNCVPEGEDKMDETTTTSSAGDYAYVGPFRGKRPDVLDRPLWVGGEIINENYLTDPSGFEKLVDALNESAEWVKKDAGIVLKQLEYVFQNDPNMKGDPEVRKLIDIMNSILFQHLISFHHQTLHSFVYQQAFQFQFHQFLVFFSL